MEFKKENPIIPGFFADPDMLKWKDTYYIYPTTDGNKQWAAEDFRVFSSRDLSDWKEESVILKTADVPWSIGYFWAPAIFERGGKFYFYFCAKREDGKSCIGVAVSDHPARNFVAKDRPIITPEMIAEKGIIVKQVIDPQVYEEGGKAYLLFGNTIAAIAELTDDLTDIRPETIRRYEGAKNLSEAIAVFKRDDLYHFTYSSDDTRSENYHIEYGTSPSLFGPIDYQYTILEKDPIRDILGTGHHCIFQEPDQDDYYIAYHRFARPSALYAEKNGCYRELCIDKIEFDEKGLIKPIKKH